MSTNITVGIVDTGVNNCFSVMQAFNSVGGDVKMIIDSGDMKCFDRLVIPGVGSYSPAMVHLEEKGLRSEILDFALSGKPILGVCLGMQLLMDKSFENGETLGLGLVSGDVIPISSLLSKDQKKRIPNIGWSEVHVPKAQNSINQINETIAAKEFYFAHSYTVVASDSDLVVGVVKYSGLPLVAALRQENILGVQFHPELSGPNGLRLLTSFLNGDFSS